MSGSFKFLVLTALFIQPTACSEKEAAPEGPRSSTDFCGKQCGDCGAGTWVCQEDGLVCQGPSSRIGDVDPVLGLKPAETGLREVFNPEDFDGVPARRIQKAADAAGTVGGAVVLEKIYDIAHAIRLPDGIMVTGGGLRRTCGAVANVMNPPALKKDSVCFPVDSTEGFTLGEAVQLLVDETTAGNLGMVALDSVADGELCVSNDVDGLLSKGVAKIFRVRNMVLGKTSWSDKIVIDSVFFDGSNRCNSASHDWRIANTLSIRGDNTVRNSIFVDTPSENITACRGVFEDNFAMDLQGSFIHISCLPKDQGPEVIRRNVVLEANLAGDEVMRHSEGLITFSANSGDIEMEENIFIGGNEGVLGRAGPDDEGILSVGDCYKDFPRIMQVYNGADESTFVFQDLELIQVPEKIIPLF